MSYYDNFNNTCIITAPLAAGMMVTLAVSSEAAGIQDAYKPHYLAISYGQECQNLLSELDQIYSETKENGWDGINSLGVDVLTYKYAKEIIVKLHETCLALPEICAEPDGELCLDWIISRQRLFSMSISKNGLLSMLEKDADTRWHGTTQYKGVIPSDVISILRKLKY